MLHVIYYSRLAATSAEVAGAGLRTGRSRLVGVFIVTTWLSQTHLIPHVESSHASIPENLGREHMSGSQGVQHGALATAPGTSFPVRVNLGFETLSWPEWIGWWVISGDLPTDYISAADIELASAPKKGVTSYRIDWSNCVAAWNEVANTCASRSLVANGTGS